MGKQKQLKYSSLLDVRFTIYLTHKSYEYIFFLVPRSSGLAKGCITKQLESVYARVECGRETRNEYCIISRVSLTRQMRLGPKKKPIWRRSGNADSRVFLNWTQSNIIRLQELRFDLHRFLNLFVNAWRHFWHRNSRMWHGRNREKSRHRSCEVCLTLLNLSLC